jgi:hypothetical protein
MYIFISSSYGIHSLTSCNHCFFEGKFHYLTFFFQKCKKMNILGVSDHQFFFFILIFFKILDCISGSKK